ncbi:autotransporter assembly complex protein TamA [Parvularcula sp. LCG005]|uniref:autotransporter assembly complex protein TamA n=1 Tax=Parvularcula sp. LCG005 TaxID=3078805 RepID=UPI002943724C|nr:BamA/TamA family outer membrane protein [Parvularcula sp. LCG005]WOI52042.1 BamA/TamA family outer membrane protein [Parvularcula sp. LCG005]
MFEFVRYFFLSFAVALVTAALPQAAAARDLKLETRIEGLSDGDLRKEMRAVSGLAQKPDGFSSLAPIRRQAEADAGLIMQALLSKGYYAATVSPDVSREELNVIVTFTVDRGPLFKITDYQIRYEDEISADRPQTLNAADIRPRQVPTGDALESIEQRLLQYLWNNGFPAAESLGRHVDAKFETGEAVAVFPVRTGPLSYFGDIRVAGTERVAATYVSKLRPFKRGDIYQREDVDEYRTLIAETGLFSEITIEPAPPLADGITDLIVTVQERKHRTVGTGLSFGTDVGVGANVFWEHRNLLGKGERLYAELDFAGPKQGAELTFTKPLPLLPGNWNTSLLLENEDTDAFSAKTSTLGFGITQYRWNRDLELSAGIQYQYSDILDNDGTKSTFSSASLPLSAIYNNENDPLNPTSGYRARLLVTPFFGDVQFNKVQIGGASRIGFGPRDKFMLAGRATLGASYGASRTDIPATERFYAGGGGSVRGYGYQEVGPLDDKGAPLGGASLSEINVEARALVRENIQIAAFVDAGSVYASETPDFSGDFLIGAGLGVRYFTPIGPLRLDIATPLTPRDPIRVQRTGEDGMPEFNEDGSPALTTAFRDDPIHVYIALGQPF